MVRCNLCYQRCNVDRLNQRGVCGLDENIYISYYGLHQGEEPCLVGDRGSGTIFFLGCTLRCSFCQNYQISRWISSAPLPDKARQVSSEKLVELFFELKNQGAANINLVSPTPYVLAIAQAIKKAKQKEFDLPFVYNSHGYDSPEALKILDGLIDIYLPDLKYSDDSLAIKYSAAQKNYFAASQQTILEMFRQVGNLKIASSGLATRGLLVRHLVLPGNLKNSLAVLDFLATLDPLLAISLMAQYHPLPQLLGVLPAELLRTLDAAEYNQIIGRAQELWLENCFVQELASHEQFLPDFTRENSFQNF